MRSTTLCLLFGVAAVAAPAYSHHSFTATYDESKTVEIKGELVQFMFRNPHAFVHVMAPPMRTARCIVGVSSGAVPARWRGRA
jgi:hypothetical protein